MSNLSNAKILGGVGAILMLVGGFLTSFLSLVGIIMVFVAIKYIADDTKDRSIFSNFLLFVILYIIAVVALAAVVFLAFTSMGFGLFGGIETGEITDPTAFFDSISDVLGICVLGFVVFYVLNIIAALYLRKSFDSITKYTNVDMFKTAGLIFFIGAILLIIGVGFIIMFIAEILMIIAFFSLPETYPTGEEPRQPSQTGRMCPNCGRPIPMDARVCPYCGKQFESFLK